MARKDLGSMIERAVLRQLGREYKDPRDGKGLKRVVATKNRTSRDVERDINRPWPECERTGCKYMRYAGAKGKLCYGHGLEEGTMQPRYSVSREIRDAVRNVAVRPQRVLQRY